jgi:hypothetical protein
MQPTTDSIVLIAGPGPEAAAPLLVIAIGLVGVLVGVMTARRGRVEGWSLLGIFGLLILGAGLAAAHMPTRLVLDRSGVELAFWGLEDRRAWPEVGAVSVRDGRFGTWVSFARPGGQPPLSLLWSRWPGLFVRDAEVEPRQVAMRIEAWRLAVKQ